MKLAAGKVEAFLRRPDPAVRGVLFYGPDHGLVRERADGLCRLILGNPPDPFRLCELLPAMLNENPMRPADEMASLSFTSGVRVVRLRDAVDAAAGPAGLALEMGAGDAALLLAEAGDLGKRSPLRSLFEAAANAVAIPCYGDDEASLQRLALGILGDAGLSLSPDASAYLAANLGGDRAMSRGEIEKLTLYMAGSGSRTVSLEDIAACIGDSREASLDAVVMAAGSGDVAALDRALDLAFASGMHPVSVIRAAARYLQRLHLAASLMAQRKSAQEAMAALRPPVFYKQQDAFRAQLRAWPPARLAQAMRLLIEVELDCKVTGAPAEALCIRALWQIATAARRAG
ncbi:MAG TPA: DNA polymerase III subunit delta [Rhodospirillales bacterium]|nr:DNA polymerase III subunit delta [Rhodospirillales bacterium]